MNGKKGNYDSGGYIVPVHGYVNIRGWRLSNDEVAKFYFAEFAKSYAAQMDQPDNVGVIGVAIFKKKMLRSGSSFSLFSFAPTDRSPKSFYGGGTKTNQTIGTGFGERTEHRVQNVQFEREASSIVVLALHYDEREGLVDRGVIMKPADKIANPFPAESGCQPPPNWRGSWTLC